MSDYDVYVTNDELAGIYWVLKDISDALQVIIRRLPPESPSEPAPESQR